MKRLLVISALCFTTLSPALWAIPTTITYQGTLKENGIPVNMSKKMIFQITDQADSTLYWTSGQLVVPVNNGLFSVQLTPTLNPGVTWDAITPYIQVSVEGQALSIQGQAQSQGEPINATTYALMANGVVDGAITPAKVAPGYGLIPSGMIAMFDSSCPSGWVVYAPLKGNFPVGADGVNFAVGVSTGSMTHSHTVNLSPHTHAISNSTLQVAIGIRNINFDNYLAMQVGSGVGTFSQFTADQWFGYNNGMSNPAPVGSNPSNVGVIGPKISGGTDVAQFSGPNTTDSQSNLPPCVGMIFCKKQ